MNRTARVRAQAKINLMLHVLGRDSTTGYHDVMTILHRIDLADEVTVRVGGKGRSLDVSGPRLPVEGLGSTEKNLAYRAAVEFAQRRGWPDAFAIELTKNVPVGGGLGGGSADAGAVLRALNALAPNPMNADELWSAGCALGSDVPFLTKDWTRAIGSRRGTDLRDLSTTPIPVAELVVVAPSFSIATPDAYRWLDEDRAASGWDPLLSPILDMSFAAESSPWTQVGRHEGMRNDFEPTIERRYPKLRQIRERLVEMGAAMAHLAGSGSSVWGVFPDGLPTQLDLGSDVSVIPTRLSSRVVQVEVLE